MVMNGDANAAPFNPLHHTGGDDTILSTFILLFSFQSTPPHRWRQTQNDVLNAFMAFQSTPPHRWRRDIMLDLVERTRLSIHSTTQVETQKKYGNRLVPILSIHSTTQVETAISYNIIQDFLLISNKLTIISYIYHQFLLHILSITIPFCIFFWCESPWNFMFA